MTTHISVLPIDVIDALAQQLDENTHIGLQFLRLPHPRTGIPSLFLPSRKSGQEQDVETILEVQNVAPNASRSWFLGDQEVVADGKLVLMTPIDPAFLLLPILEVTVAADGYPGNFRTLDDLMEIAIAKLEDLKPTITETKDETTQISGSDVTTFVEMQCAQKALRRICEYKDLTEDLTVYRYSREKVVEYTFKKVNRLCKAGTIDASRTMTRELARDGLMEDGKETLLDAGRRKMACDLLSQYLPSNLYQELLLKFDFTALEAHVGALKESSLSEAVPAASKKGTDPDGNNETDGKKRKAATQRSKGVEKLKKANIKGMAKLSNFFQKAETKAKS